LNDFRNLGLIFDLEPPFIKEDDKILIFDKMSFEKILIEEDERIEEGIYHGAGPEDQNGLKKGDGFLGIQMVKNMQKEIIIMEDLLTNLYMNGQKYEAILLILSNRRFDQNLT